MTTELKLSRNLYNRIKADLLRPHPFAYERVGFVFGKIGSKDTGDRIILLYDYLVLEDKDYVEDQSVGAKINSGAIRKALQRILDHHDCAFHVHLHDFPGKPHFSGTDSKDLSRLIPSFHSTAPDLPHGAVLLGQDDIYVQVLMPENKYDLPTKISVVGFPLKIFKWIK